MLWNVSIYSNFLDQRYPISDVEGENWLSALQAEPHIAGLREIDIENLAFQVRPDDTVKVTNRVSTTTVFLTPVESPPPEGEAAPANTGEWPKERIFL